MPKHLNEDIGPFLNRKSTNRLGTQHARGTGWFYHRHDLERVRAIMDALGCRASTAAWLFHAVKVLATRDLVPFLLEDAKELEQAKEPTTHAGKWRRRKS
jgi:glycine/D-amino acid oxidase-like deaminating enzyme